jgi:hypothetical protein
MKRNANANPRAPKPRGNVESPRINHATIAKEAPAMPKVSNPRGSTWLGNAATSFGWGSADGSRLRDRPRRA